MRPLVILAVLSAVVACGASRDGKHATLRGSALGDSAEDRTPWERSKVDWSRPPAALEARPFRPPAAHERRLDNGLRVVTVERHGLPLVALSLAFPFAGTVFDGPIPGLAGLTADLLDEGIDGLDALALAARLEELGAALTVETSQDAVVVRMQTLAETLGESLDLLTQIASRPLFAAGDFERVRTDRQNALERSRDHARSVAIAALLRALYGEGNPYGHGSLGTHTGLSAVKLADVKRFYREHYSPRGAILTATGDFRRPEFVAKLEETLGLWSGTPTPARPPVVAAANRPRLVMIDKPDAPQTVMLLGRVGLARADARYVVSEALNTALGGSFTSRLNNRLREQLGYTYGASSRFSYWRSPGPWYAHTALFADKTLAGIREARDIVAACGREPMPGAEFDRTRSLLAQSMPQLFETNESTLTAFEDLALYERPLDTYDSYRDEVNALTAAEVHQLGREFLAASEMTLVVVGNLAVLRPQLRSLGLGPGLETAPDGTPVLATAP